MRGIGIVRKSGEILEEMNGRGKCEKRGKFWRKRILVRQVPRKEERRKSKNNEERRLESEDNGGKK